MPPRSIRWTQKLALVSISLLLTCAVLELGLRITYGLERRRARANAAASQGEYWAIYDRDLGYRPNPRFGDLNEDGLRNGPIGPKAGRARLLFLGDSIAHDGDSVDDTIVARMGAHLRREWRFRDLDVINAGIRGYTTYQEILYLETRGLRFEPDVVGVLFCLNDVHKFLHSFAMKDGQIVPGTYQFSEEAIASTRPAPRTLADRVADRSHLLSWLRAHVGLARDVISWQMSRGYSFDYRRDLGTAWQDRGWPDVEVQLARALELGRANGFRLFVAVVPVAAQYDARYLARDRDYVLKPQRRLEEICARLGIPLYDLYPDGNAQIFLDDGIHLTQEGRERLSRPLARFVAESGLLTRERTAPTP